MLSLISHGCHVEAGRRVRREERRGVKGWYRCTGEMVSPMRLQQ